MKNSLIEYLFELRDVKDRGVRYIYDGDEEKFVSYHELYVKSRSIANYLKKVPFKNIILQIISIVEFIYLVWACLFARKIIIPIKLAKSDEEVNRIIDILKISNNNGIILDQENELLNNYIDKEKRIFSSELLDYKSDFEYDICEKTNLEDVILIQFSSGSTGDPKGVLTTNKNLVTNMSYMIEKYNYEEEDKKSHSKVIDWIPLTHNLGLIVGHFATVMRGIDEYILPTESFISNPMILLEKINKYRITTFHTPNFGLDLISKYSEKYSGKQLDLSCLTTISIGGERVSDDTCENFIKVMSRFNMPSTAVQPGYGLSEATVTVCDAKDKKFVVRYLNRNKLSIGEKIEEVEAKSDNSVSFVELGEIWGCCKAIITDDLNKKLEDGYIGRIKLKGDTISKGYYSKNGEVVSLDLDSNGWIDTGDIGFIIDNRLTVIGRSKDVIIVNGKNLYPSDLETIIYRNMNIPKSFVAVAGVYNDTEKSDDIVAFIKNSNIDKSDVDTIKMKVKSQTGYNIKDIIFVDNIPKTSNGKIIRYKLCEIYKEMLSKEEKKSSSKSNKKKLVSKVMNIIREVLEDNSIEATDDIFDYNVSSIKIMIIVGLIKNELNYKGEIRDWIESDTFYDFIKTLKEEKCINAIEVDKGNLEEEFSLNNIQMSYYLGRAKDFELGNISTHAYLEIESEIDIKRFNSSFQEVIDNQPMLRDVITSNGMQKIINKVEPYEIKVIDVTGKKTEDVERVIKEEREKSEQFIFNANKWPLFELKAIKLGDNLYRLMFGIDMIIADAVSIQLIFNQIYKVYNGEKLEICNVTFKDYINYLKNIKNSTTYKLDEQYWKNKVKEMPPAANLPLKYNICEIEKPVFKRKSYIFDKDKWNKIVKQAMEYRIRPTFVLLYAYALVLSKWSNQDKLTINTTVFNRPQFSKDINKLVGDFTILMLTSIYVGKNGHFYEKAKLVQEEFLNNFMHKDYEGVNVIRDYCKYNGIDKNSCVMPIVFTSVLDSEYSGNIEKNGKIKYMTSQTSQVYLDYQVVNVDDGLLITWDYVENLFSNETIDDMFKTYIDILDKLSSGINEIKVENDRVNRIYDNYNKTDKKVSEDTLHGLFKKQCKLTPNNIAIKLKEKELTYKELDEKSNQIASYLLEHGVGSGKYVAVMAERRIESIINIIGILKTGAAYVPINTDYPQQRIDYIKNEINSFDILDSDKCNKILSEVKSSSLNKLVFNNIDDVAYIIYTSGSTGVPKGVVLSHKAVVNTIKDINDRFSVSEKDRIIGLSSLSFDLSVYDVFGTLACGAQLIMVEEQRDISEVHNIVVKDKISIWNSVPMIMEMYMNYLQEENYLINNELHVRVAMLSGDWIPINLPERIKNKFDNCDVISLGGATEASIWSIYYPIKEIKENWTSIPYGYPLRNQKYYVLSYDKSLCPVNVKGELYIGGIGLANGYYNNEEKTSSCFIKHNKFGKLYRTGDFGMMTDDGFIEFLGRQDSQVKIKGYRVELQEIEKEILKYKDIKKAIVINCKYINDIESIFSFVVSDKAININNLKNNLIEKLPKYMIPKKIIQVEAVPLLSNGKVSKRKLIDLIQEQMDEVAVDKFIEARTEIEKRVSDLWKKVLNINKVDIFTDFYEQGGDSIITIKLLTLLEKELNVKISLKTFMLNSSVNKIAKIIENSNNLEKSNEESIEKIGNNIYKISGGVNDSNVYLIKNDKKVVLIDAGCKEGVVKFVEDENCKISTMILTHAHCDHICYAEELKRLYNAKYIMHNKEKALALDMYNNGMRSIEKEFYLSDKDRIIKDAKEVIDVDGLKFTIYNTPGHTDGSICIKYLNYIFVGDTLSYDNEENTDANYGNEEMLISSKKMIKEEFGKNTFICPGHGDICTIKDLIEK